MKLLENFHYRWIDSRKKIVFIIAVLISIGLIIMQSYFLKKETQISVYLAHENIAAGELLNEDNLEKVMLDEDIAIKYNYLIDIGNYVAKDNIQIGMMVISNMIVEMNQFIVKKEEDRLVTIKLEIDEADSWLAEKGDKIELAHYNEDEFDSMKIFKDIIVFDLIYMNNNDEFPEYAVLLVNEDLRSYIIANRDNGRFEISI